MSKICLFIMLAAILAATRADVKHLSKKYLPPATSASLNGLTQSNQRDFDENGAGKIVNGAAAATTSQESQDPFPGPFIPTSAGIGGFGFPGGAGAGFPNFVAGPANNFLPGAVPNFPPQSNFQAFPDPSFQQGLNQPNFGFPQPGAGFQQQGFGPGAAFAQPFNQQMQQFGNNQAFGGAFPGFQAPQFGGLNFQQAGLQQPFLPQAGLGGFQQAGFGFDNQQRKSNDEVGTIYGSNHGYVYEKPTSKV